MKKQHIKNALLFLLLFSVISLTPAYTTEIEHRDHTRFNRAASGSTGGAVAGETVKTTPVTARENTGSVGIGIFPLRIDLLEIKPTETKILSSRTIQVESGKLANIRILFKSSISSKHIAAHLNILPDILEKGIQLDLRFKVDPIMKDFNQAVLVTRNHESAILEFLESPTTQTKIAFQVTPLLNTNNTETIHIPTDAQLAAGKGAETEEEVSVRWWVVPVFAVDKKGKSVENLEKQHLQVKLDKKIITTFHLYKKEISGTPPQTKTPAETFKPAPKVVFFVFDNYNTPLLMLAKAKSIARNLIKKSENDSFYVLLSLDYIAGLNYITGPTKDKTKLLEALKKDLKPGYGNFRQENPLHLESSIKHRTRDTLRVRKQGNFSLRRNRAIENHITQTFLRGLRTLNTTLGTLEECSRVVYFFSTGIADSDFLRVTAGNLSVEPYYYDRLKDIGHMFNKNSALLFVINPMGTRISMHNSNSGENSLRHLAESSGGRYYEGEKEQITNQVINMDRAFYEIAFPDTGQLSRDVRTVNVSATKPGLKVYSVKKVTRGKNYRQMKKTDREILILNAVENGYLAKIKLKLKKISLKVEKETTGSLFCRLDLPGHVEKVKWDIYKIRKNKNGLDVKMETESSIPTGNYFEMLLKKEKNFENVVVVVHPSTATAFIAHIRPQKR
ncbi:MAG: hypothetical protein GY757_13265 [bacterium]|nr:hypothetical protein [bacterium]